MRLSSLHDLPVSDDPRQILAHVPASIAGLPLAVLPIPGHGRLTADYHPTPRIFVAQQGYGRRWYRCGSATMEMYTAPRMIEVYERGLAFDEEIWEGEPGRCVLVKFGDQDVEALTHGEVRSLELSTRHEIFDDRICRLVFDLAHEAFIGMPSGALYAQGLCVCLLDALLDRYAPGAGAGIPAARTLRPAQQRRLAELFREQLGTPLTLTRMAAETNLSPQHFGRLFKSTFGTTPHDHVQSLRIDAAVKALRRDADLSIADIALACGFASQSHMTETIRRRLGVTPSALRRGSPAGPRARP
jgi:AraC family transcriptional regulator